MAEGDVLETVHGKHHVYEIREARGTFYGETYVIYRDGARWKGQYDSLARAVEVARDAG